MTLDEAREHVGDRVLYHAPWTKGTESGEIVRVNETVVFVRYGDDVTPKATYPADLTLMAVPDDAEG